MTRGESGGGRGGGGGGRRGEFGDEEGEELAEMSRDGTLPKGELRRRLGRQRGLEKQAQTASGWLTRAQSGSRQDGRTSRDSHVLVKLARGSSLPFLDDAGLRGAGDATRFARFHIQTPRERSSRDTPGITTEPGMGDETDTKRKRTSWAERKVDERNELVLFPTPAQDPLIPPIDPYMIATRESSNLALDSTLQCLSS